MRTLTIKLPHTEYPLYIGTHLLTQHRLLSPFITGQQVMIISDENVAPLYLRTLQNLLPSMEQKDIFIIPPGETQKNLSTFQAISEALANRSHHRDTTLISLGGGVVGDMTGFVAACYQRGVNFIQIPTSLLAQIDASIGGKTGLNLPQGKNLIGSYHHPQAVIIDINTLNTLSPRELKAGLAEMIKAGLIADPGFINYIEQHLDALLRRDPAVLIEAVYRACQIKQRIVIQDEKEKGARLLLNLGHTFGHAIEQYYDYQRYLHGEAVAIGIHLAAALSHHLGYLEATALDRINELLANAGLPTHLSNGIKYDKLYRAIQTDKKVLGLKQRMILLRAIGNAFVHQGLSESDLRTFFTVHKEAIA